MKGLLLPSRFVEKVYSDLLLQIMKSQHELFLAQQMLQLQNDKAQLLQRTQEEMVNQFQDMAKKKMAMLVEEMTNKGFS